VGGPARSAMILPRLRDAMPELRIGTSGFEYDDWKGRLYPHGLARTEWLPSYAARFSSVELNTTFYGLPDRGTVQRWRDSVPDGFRFALKLSRYGTHMKRLKDPHDWLERFERALSPLGLATGPILVQLPPRWHRDPERLAAFLDAVPCAWRIAVEVRDPDWLHRDVYAVLRQYAAALCIHDLLEHHPRPLTADWVYLRFHGPDRRAPYVGSYSSQALSGAARRLRRHLQAGRDVYAYFNNDDSGHAVANALALKRYLDDAGT
jgi:uncharacterized protein YecE (DUF72 family)